MKKLKKLPFIMLQERIPLVDQLVDLVKERDDYISELEQEIKRLKKLPQRPKLNASKLKQDKKALSTSEKRPGSVKTKKSEKLIITDIHTVNLPNVPEGAVFKGYREYRVQDISIKLVNHLFKCARYRTKEGTYLQATLPAAFRNEHFGPNLRAYIAYQYHHQGVTQPLLLKQLKEWDIQISTGQLNRLINDKNDHFHAEKEEIFETGLFLSAYIQTDDTGARHQGRNGYCTYIGNELFAYFKSTASKSRLNFIRCLQGKAPGFRLDKTAFSYLKAHSNTLTLKLIHLLSGVMSFTPRIFASQDELTAYLQKMGVLGAKALKFCLEAAAYSHLKSLRLDKDILILSDEAGQFRLPYMKHSLCWMHVERKLKQLVPMTSNESIKLNEKLSRYWQLYQDLTEYKLWPSQWKKMELQNQFTQLCCPVEEFPQLNEVLERINKWEEALLLSLDYPYLPLHNNMAESDIREYVRRRKINGTTRNENGRASRDTFSSIKKTCYKLGINFWKYLQNYILKLPQLNSLADHMYAKARKNQAMLSFALIGTKPFFD
jgi:hypothetical protein